MARKVITELIDDISGEVADSTVVFTYNGATYEIDLSNENKAALDEALAPYVKAARKTGGRATRGTATKSNSAELQKIRDWAAKNGIEVSSRGRIAQTVVDQYNAAN